MARRTAGAVSNAERWVISSPVAATQLSMNAGEIADRFMKAVERATANKSLHSGPRRRGNDKAGYRRSLRDTTERERLGQCREFETATVLLTNAPSTTAIAQADDLAG